MGKDNGPWRGRVRTSRAQDNEEEVFNRDSCGKVTVGMSGLFLATTSHVADPVFRLILLGFPVAVY